MGVEQQDREGIVLVAKNRETGAVTRVCCYGNIEVEETALEAGVTGKVELTEKMIDAVYGTSTKASGNSAEQESAEQESAKVERAESGKRILIRMRNEILEEEEDGLLKLTESITEWVDNGKPRENKLFRRESYMNKHAAENWARDRVTVETWKEMFGR